MSTASDAVVAGHLCLDLIPDLNHIAPEAFGRLFQPGRLLEIGPATFATGGPVSNTGLALHKLGVRTSLMGKVGEDVFGGAVRDYIASIDPALVAGMGVSPDVNTSYTVVINPPGVDRIFLHHPGANDSFFAADLNYDIIAHSRLFHFGYPPLMRTMYVDGGEELQKIFRQARATGVTTSLDMALPDPTSASGQAPWPEILGKTLPQVDIFLPSIEELLFTLRRNTYERLRKDAGGPDILPLITPELLAELSEALHEMGVAVVVIKLGRRGLYLHTADAGRMARMGRAGPEDAAAWANLTYWAPTFQVEVVGTTGAGDATIAGFLAALLRGLSPEDALNMATAVGACNVEAADSLSGIRPWEETRARVLAGWPKRQESLDAFGWRYHSESGLWSPEA